MLNSSLSEHNKRLKKDAKSLACVTSFLILAKPFSTARRALWWQIGLIAFVTIIGIPFGIQHLKLARLALAPIGKTIIDSDYAEAVREGAV